MKLTTEIKIPSNVVPSLQKALNEPNPDFGRDDVVWEGHSRFSDGTQALFQICASSEPAEESCWSQIVLLDEHGAEIACSDVSETLFGPCDFFYIDGTAYTVNVVQA